LLGSHLGACFAQGDDVLCVDNYCASRRGKFDDLLKVRSGRTLVVALEPGALSSCAMKSEVRRRDVVFALNRSRLESTALVGRRHRKR